MYQAQIENSGGESLTLNGNETRWQVLSITGLNPPPAQINTTNISGMDGARFNSSKLGTRNIVIMLRINGNVEDNRQELYRFFRTKDVCTFYFSNDNRDVLIQGYVETVECDLFEQGQTMQISIICPYPYFQAIQNVIVDISNEVATFSFPFSINHGEPIPFTNYISNRVTNVKNNSETETGVMIGIYVLSDVGKIQIKDTDTGDSLTLVYSFLENDRIVINTEKGNKNISLIRNGVEANLFTALQEGSVFFQLKVGDNHFGYLVNDGSDDDAVYIVFDFSYKYRGV